MARKPVLNPPKTIAEKSARVQARLGPNAGKGAKDTKPPKVKPYVKPRRGGLTVGVKAKW